MTDVIQERGGRLSAGDGVSNCRIISGSGSAGIGNGSGLNSEGDSNDSNLPMDKGSTFRQRT
jgi:hypothetical protein